ncbi:MAG TPA: BamA/TamA family outer membrane protein, partial [Chitinophagaceae bacterium]|nr:BamA/TamA family outer membrane protein [Chitinophagaceae bacterium]
KIRMVGGSGKDHFLNEGDAGRLFVYDVNFEENKFSGNENGLRKKITSDPQNNMYNRLYYRYNFINPGVSISYNIDDGLYLGAKLETTIHGFRKDPYKSHQFIRANRALGTSSFRFTYQGEFIKSIGNADLLIDADVRAPINVTNFFGLGNNTVFDKTKPGRIRYYRARYDIADFSALLRRRLQSWMRVTYGLTYQYYRVEEKQNIGKFLTQPGLPGVNRATLYDHKSFVGAQLGLDINSKNNQAVPSRGFVLDAGFRPLVGMGNSNRLTQTHLDMRLFASFKQTARLVYAIRVGGGHNFGDYEFPQAQYLGGTDNLRGYRKDRFAGRSMLYNNTEVRLKIADFNTYLFPGSFGLFVFNDVGRVWAGNETEVDWHVGNGGGIWLSPVRRFVVTAAYTRSKEERGLPLVTFGFQF